MDYEKSTSSLLALRPVYKLGECMEFNIEC